MPHAEQGTMGEPVVNGEKVHSQFLSHLTSYPVVSDSIDTFKSNKYGAKSLDFADQGYERFAKPFLPYLSKPYGYVAPYLEKADSLGDQGLKRVDKTFPIIKEDTDKIRGTVFDTAYFPVQVVGDIRKHLLETFDSEYKKCGDGLVASGKALITTGLVISQESLAWLSSILAARKEQTKEAINEKVN